MKSITIIASLILLMASGVWAADWQWPSQMDVGGFRVTNIQGTTQADGSGSATGILQIPGLGSSNISLTRSARGDISGTTSLNTRPVHGSFALSGSGLNGRGSIDCSPSSINDAAISVNSRGQASGSGRMSFGRLNVSVDFTVSGSSCSVNGSAPVSAKVDTAVATYKFDGRLVLGGSNGGAVGSVSGRVERTGKLTNQATTYNIPNTSVNLSNGQCTINVGGVSVSFSLF